MLCSISFWRLSLCVGRGNTTPGWPPRLEPSTVPGLNFFFGEPGNNNRCCFRGGHFRYFSIFSLIKKEFFCIFIKCITYFCTVLFKKPTPSQINLIKNARNHFFIVKKFQKYLKCPALQQRIPSSSSPAGCLERQRFDLSRRNQEARTLSSFYRQSQSIRKVNLVRFQSCRTNVCQRFLHGQDEVTCWNLFWPLAALSMRQYPVGNAFWVMSQQRHTLTQTILVHLTPGCRKEIACKVFFSKQLKKLTDKNSWFHKGKINSCAI